MPIAQEEDALSVQAAYLEGRLQQVAEEWNQLGQWLDSDQNFLASVQAHTATICASLATAGPIDQQVRNALAELVVIGQVQQFLLEQSMQQTTCERNHLEAEGVMVRRALGLHLPDIPLKG